MMIYASPREGILIDDVIADGLPVETVHFQNGNVYSGAKSLGGRGTVYLVETEFYTEDGLEIAGLKTAKILKR